MHPKKALCIGINYYGTRNQLHGCINDATDYKALLETRYGYAPENIRLICDTPGYPLQPTGKTILDGMQWLASDLSAGDKVVLTYSGHGSYLRDQNGDESDGQDEALCALDGMIRDDTIYDVLIKKIPAGAQLACLFDCCHSGTMADLQYTFRCDTDKRTSYRLMMESKKQAPGDVFMYSGCFDHQVSLDIRTGRQYRMDPATSEYKWDDGRACGAFTYTLLNLLKDSGTPAQSLPLHKDMVRDMNLRLKKQNFDQVSQFSCSRIDLIEQPFDM